jgi:hypothetical protein
MQPVIIRAFVWRVWLLMNQRGQILPGPGLKTTDSVADLGKPEEIGKVRIGGLRPRWARQASPTTAALKGQPSRSHDNSPPAGAAIAAVLASSRSESQQG